MEEKQLLHSVPNTAKSKLRRARHWVASLAVFTLLFIWLRHNDVYLTIFEDGKLDSEPQCPQVSPLYPSNHLARELGQLYDTEDFLLRAAEWLGGAVRIPTESYDDTGPVGEDPRWDVFGHFHEYLQTAFPFVHINLKLTKVNTYGLLYEWEGSDPSLKSILLMAHQDVVPVDPQTVDQWVQPPYSGFYDGTWIWGRGSADDKNGLIGVLAAVESLLERGFKPRRSVTLAFGFDEEASGSGAKSIAEYLLKTKGSDIFSILVDEGGGFLERDGAIFAIPAVGEKGYLDVRIDVAAPGGHSSIPPPHTSIGILSSLLVTLESNPRVPRLSRSSPVFDSIQCFAEHAPELPDSFRRTIKESLYSDRALKQVEDILFQDLAMKSLVGTTQAIDMIGGGVTSNALPEQAWAIVDHRISTDSTLEAVQKYIIDLVEPVSRSFNASLNAFGRDIFDDSTDRHITLQDAWGTGLQPAPITPTGTSAEPFKLLSGTIRATYESSVGFQKGGRSIFVAPGIMSGNTDTRYYWQLTKHIFRYEHLGQADIWDDVHTVNEAIRATGFTEMIKFFTNLILNCDESRDI